MSTQTQLVSLQDQTIEPWLTTALEDVEARFAAELISDLPCVNRLLEHIERYQGKMLRPRLVLVSAMACSQASGKPSNAQQVLATVVELVHMATLVHDDILDEAHIRRGGDTINYLAGNETAVMLGDYLISHAYHLCSSLDNMAISRSIADTTNRVCEGELLQLANRFNWSLDEQSYFEIIRRKTASLCGVCCQLAAELGGRGAGVAEGLYEYGEKVGVAFQIVDDLLDLVGVERTVGKTLGRDVDKGKLTLPLIHHLSTADKASYDAALLILGKSKDDSSGQLSRDQLDEIHKLVTDSGAVDYAVDWASRMVVQAKAALEVLPQSPARNVLSSMADLVLTRKF